MDRVKVKLSDGYGVDSKPSWMVNGSQFPGRAASTMVSLISADQPKLPHYTDPSRSFPVYKRGSEPHSVKRKFSNVPGPGNCFPKLLFVSISVVEIERGNSPVGLVI